METIVAIGFFGIICTLATVGMAVHRLTEVYIHEITRFKPNK